MTSVANCTVTGTALPNSSGTIALENLLVWHLEVYRQLFLKTTFQSDDFVDRLPVVTSWRTTESIEGKDWVAYQVYVPMVANASSQSLPLWQLVAQPTAEANLVVPTAYRVIKT